VFGAAREMLRCRRLGEVCHEASRSR
jgi:hypothetical protein